MNKQKCTNIKTEVKKLDRQAEGCGFRVHLESAEESMKRYLRTPSLGALLWTQVWALGARMYFWFILSLIPIVGFVPLIVLTIRGRQLSWNTGQWENFEVFKRRMRILDIVALVWLIIIVGVYLFIKYK